MQLLSDASSLEAAPDACARDLMETVPLVMQFIRGHMRSLRGHELTVAQLRTLYNVSRGRRPSLSEVAEHIGLSLPAMSRMVDALVKKGLMTRTSCEQDRRHLRLELTRRGQTALDQAWNGTHDRLSAEIAALPAEQRGIIQAAMHALRPVFEPEPGHHGAHAGAP
jgi:DNA-binding MarR family transcriptional regulator